MKAKVLGIAAISLVLASGSAFAQSSTVTGAAGGAATGAVVGGPVGAAIGGVAGAIVGTAIDPPPQRVVTYVEEQPIPDDSVVVREKVVVGRPLPERVVIRQIPENPKYAYAVVNHQRVIVEPQSRKVIRVLE
ncbi:DUF1236 domain-containing protein [Rhizobium calliandrae]|uniref:DUF1236 domain-containing protein n=1 Tax=Rhizobium calliandrae TaxID=1312182 RepID=A0ABT7KE34_9HYPH|nr:DUF1236 domain-containing protein [Rhizobium calliandrae]MDL2406891.1 DUF1236 domain-containing protein [Rhizobium calliandrae]